jgi:hypothetical protein
MEAAMPWTGYPETAVTQLTFYREWTFSLKAQREVLIGYSIRVENAWELFGNGHWVWFTGGVASNSGAIQIVAQWAEVQPLGPQQRVWQWVHWRNPSQDDVVVQPYVLLAPAVGYGYLVQSEPTTVRKRIWTIADLATSSIVALGSLITEAGEGGNTGGRELQASLMVQPLSGQRLREIELEGDLRYLPVEELRGRIDHLLENADLTDDALSP